MQFKIATGYQNPSYIFDRALDSIELTTLTPNRLGKYDQLTQNIIIRPNLSPNQLTDLDFTRSGSSLIAGLSNLSAVFTATDYFLSSNGTIMMYFPKYTFY